MQSTQCLECKHYTGAATCAAFPDGIPAVILTGEHDHREPYPNDNGVRWELADDADTEIDEAGS